MCPPEIFAVANAKKAIASRCANAMVNSYGTVNSPSVIAPVTITDCAPKNTNKAPAKNLMNDDRQASIDVNSSFLKFGSISIPKSAGLQLLLPCDEIGQSVHDSILVVYNSIDLS